MKKFVSAALMMGLLSIGTPLLLAEESEGHSKAEEQHETNPLWKWVNLLVLIGGIGFLLRKPASEFFETRKKDITSGLDRARTAQEESSRRMAEIEKRLSRLSQEIAGLRTQADADSSKERDNILAEAKRDMERLVDQSRQEVDRIARGIERDIKAKIADAVIDRASRTLETQMTEDDQKRIVVRFLNKV
jgi:F-type H+-transporting ATPase subunit b